MNNSIIEGRDDLNRGLRTSILEKFIWTTNEYTLCIIG